MHCLPSFNAFPAGDVLPEPLKLRRLERLVLLANALNFACAAELACLSQSAFSRSVQALEESLGKARWSPGS